MAKATLLIAEDDAVLRNLYLKKFTVEGYDVKTCENGEDVIASLKQNAPDLLICDIHMPKADGFQVLREFPRANRKYPIIMLTNFDQDDFKVRAEELGADDYFIKKDMTIRTLVEMVDRLLSGKK